MEKEPYDIDVERGFIEDKKHAMEKLILVEHRDEKGVLIPLKLNHCQGQLHELYEKVRAFRVVKNMLLSKDKDEIAKVLGISISQKFSTLVRKIGERNIDALLSEFKKKAPHL